MFHQHSPQGDDLSLSNRPRTPLEHTLVEKLKDAFVEWSVDQNIPCAGGTALFQLRLHNRAGRAVRMAQEITPTIHAFISSEIKLEALWRTKGEDVEDVEQRVRGKIDHEIKIVKNGFILAQRIAKALASPDPDTRRRQLSALNRSSLEFALGDTSHSVALDGLRPILVAAKALGLSDVERQIEPALAEYRNKTSFQAPVFMRALQSIVADQNLTSQALEGLPKETANDLVCSATRVQYPKQGEYQHLRESCSRAALDFLESVMKLFEVSANPFAESVARLYRDSDVVPHTEEPLNAAIDRELRVVYGAV